MENDALTFYVYILFAPDFNKFYIGQTNNLNSRIQRHNKGYEKFTRKFRPWVLLY